MVEGLQPVARDAPTLSGTDEASEPSDVLYVEAAAQPAAVQDRWWPWRDATAWLLALLLHAGIILALLTGPKAEVPAVPPAAIPVEIVHLPKLKPLPKLAQQPKPAPKQQQPPPPQPKPEIKEAIQTPPQLVHRQSGGDPSLTPGAPNPKPENPELTIPKPPPPPPPKPAQQPKPQPAEAQTKSPKPPRPAQVANLPTAPGGTVAQQTAPALAAQPKAGTTAPPNPSVPAKPTNEMTALTPMPVQPNMPARLDSQIRGQGGGDRYLNALRDIIVSNIIYPQAARGSSGVAKYVMVISRQGWMLDLRLVESSASVALDRAGMDAIQNSAPFEPLPPTVPGKAVAIDVYLYLGPPGSTPAADQN
jgi:TonB family protein